MHVDDQTSAQANFGRHIAAVLAEKRQVGARAVRKSDGKRFCGNQKVRPKLEIIVISIQRVELDIDFALSDVLL